MYSPTTLPRSARIYKPISAPTSDPGTVVTSTPRQHWQRPEATQAHHLVVQVSAPTRRHACRRFRAKVVRILVAESLRKSFLDGWLHHVRAPESLKADLCVNYFVGVRATLRTGSVIFFVEVCILVSTFRRPLSAEIR